MMPTLLPKAAWEHLTRARHSARQEVGGVGVNYRALARQGLHILTEETENQSE